MEMTQINTRISLELKQRGDEVLLRCGATTSDVIRAVWTYMVEKQQLPSFMLDQEQDRNFSYLRKCDEIDRGSHLLRDYCKDLGIPLNFVEVCSSEELREYSEEEMMVAYEKL